MRMHAHVMHVPHLALALPNPEGATCTWKGNQAFLAAASKTDVAPFKSMIASVHCKLKLFSGKAALTHTCARTATAF